MNTQSTRRFDTDEPLDAVRDAASRDAGATTLLDDAAPHGTDSAALLGEDVSTAAAPAPAGATTLLDDAAACSADESGVWGVPDTWDVLAGEPGGTPARDAVAVGEVASPLYDDELQFGESGVLPVGPATPAAANPYASAYPAGAYAAGGTADPYAAAADPYADPRPAIPANAGAANPHAAAADPYAVDRTMRMPSARPPHAAAVSTGYPPDTDPYEARPINAVWSAAPQPGADDDPRDRDARRSKKRGGSRLTKWAFRLVVLAALIVAVSVALELGKGAVSGFVESLKGAVSTQVDNLLGNAQQAGQQLGSDAADALVSGATGAVQDAAQDALSSLGISTDGWGSPEPAGPGDAPAAPDVPDAPLDTPADQPSYDEPAGPDIPEEPTYDEPAVPDADTPAPDNGAQEPTYDEPAPDAGEGPAPAEPAGSDLGVTVTAPAA